jgi:hypothetical protein
VSCNIESGQVTEQNRDSVVFCPIILALSAVSVDGRLHVYVLRLVLTFSNDTVADKLHKRVKLVGRIDTQS